MRPVNPPDRSPGHPSNFSVAALDHNLFHRLGLAPVTTFKLAFSGGVDSMVLLHALARLRRQRSFDLSAVHVDHGLQPRSPEWAQHCAAVCRELAVPCAIERVQVQAGAGHGPEAAARAARYARLRRHIGPDEVLLTAHHQDDQAETVLLQLLRGGGVQGLAAVAPVSAFGAGRLVRPLLTFTRAALLEYAQQHGLRWIDDPSNADRRYARNFLRHEVMPLLRQRWPEAGALLGRTAGHAADAVALLDEVAQADMAACGAAPPALSVPCLAPLSPPRLRNVLRYWLRRQGFDPPSTRHLEEVVQCVLRASKTRHAAVRWPGVEVRRYRDRLYALAPLTPPSQAEVLWEDLHTPLALPELGWRLHARAHTGQGLAQTRLAARSLRVCLRRGGESCLLPGRAHHHKLKKLLQAAGVPPWRRDRLPLLYVDQDLAAVADLWVCAPYQAQPHEPGWVIELEDMRPGNF